MLSQLQAAADRHLLEKGNRTKLKHLYSTMSSLGALIDCQTKSVKSTCVLACYIDIHERTLGVQENSSALQRKLPALKNKNFFQHFYSTTPFDGTLIDCRTKSVKSTCVQHAA
jgi:hypothetical protein